MAKLFTDTDYPIYAGENLNDVDWQIFEGYSSYIILVDENTRALCLPLLQKAFPKLNEALIFEIPSGEAYKQISTCDKLWKSMLNNNIDRNALFINLGGGVIGDMGGFVASTFKRGIAFIQIPTTLLAQVDASIGGKLGVDCANIKNSVGLFNNPKSVIICTAFLNTLPKRELMAGYAEILKHGLIADKALWEILTSTAISNTPSLSLIKQAVGVKHTITQRDPLERGDRKKLNFGHTIGHAIESYSLQYWVSPLLHGEAVALGMLAEAKLSANKIGLSTNELCTIEEEIKNAYTYISPEAMNIEELIQFMMNDKKNSTEGINFTLLNHIGVSSVNHVCTPTEIKSAVNYLINLYEV